MVNKFGTYVKTVSQEDANFYGAMYGKEEATKYLGHKITWTSRDMGDGAIAFHWDCGVSSMFYIFHANIEQNVNLPQFGGMNKVKYMVTADGYDTDMESEKYGKLHIVEKYTDDGVTIVTTYKGKTHTEFAKRVINENGFYRLASQEGWYEMMKADGMPMDLVKSLYGNIKFHWTNCGDSYKVTECLGNGTKDSYSAKFDQEIDRPNPCLAGASTKVVMSKLGAGKYKVIMKDTTKGTVYDITDQFFDGYIISCGKNLSTGMTFKCKFEKFVCFEGKYKTISMENCKEILDALGLPADMKQKALTDYGTLEFTDKCPVYHWKWDSAISPLDITFKMDEEVEYFDKFINEHTKVVSSQSGNKLMTTAKNSYGTWVTTSTFTDSFCIMKCALVGLDLPPMVIILEKISLMTTTDTNEGSGSRYPGPDQAFKVGNGQGQGLSPSMNSGHGPSKGLQMY